ncbi:unnamed protein product [Cylicocyclus nassatus]|uniref:Endonuclease/exonuclease/phosphatase domain-containing protein n=1 Tax=Cylicocyclus nassatus TaxID=53992 RepID=A0AA36GGG3_CYLNA|nr:unnamed protein product [Cylicocyclus nassatus]
MSNCHTWNNVGPLPCLQAIPPTPAPLPLGNNHVFGQVYQIFATNAMPNVLTPQTDCVQYNKLMHGLSWTAYQSQQISAPLTQNLPLVPPHISNSVMSRLHRNRGFHPFLPKVVWTPSPPKIVWPPRRPTPPPESEGAFSDKEPTIDSLRMISPDVPLILPKNANGPEKESTSINIFRMILEEDQHIRPQLPVVDLEEEIITTSSGKVVIESPAPKKRKEESDDCVILDDIDEGPSSSTPRAFEFARPEKVKKPWTRRDSKLPWNPLEATFHVPEPGLLSEKVKKPGTRRDSRLPWNPLEATFHVPEAGSSSGSSSMEKVVDLTIEEENTTETTTTTTNNNNKTLRDVLENLCIPASPPEEGELTESSDDVETGDDCVIEVTSEDDLQLTLRSQEEGDVIDLTAEKEFSDSEVVCMEDLTVVDEEEVTVIQRDDVVTKTTKKKTKKRLSTKTSTRGGMSRKPADEDALSRSTKQLTGVTPRYWEKFTAAPQPSSSNAEFRVCSYNVLCDLTTKKTMYLYRHLSDDESALSWEHRWPLLEQELLRLNADVYGLQEVQHDHYDSHFRPAMAKVGYFTYYKQRTNGLSDGCAVFVRKSKFDVVRYRIVEYFVANGTTMDRDQIGQILQLRCKKTGQEIIYANTHLLYNSARGDIKLGQLAMLIANIQDILKENRCPVIINGDFNIEPLSYVYTFVSESSVYLRGLPRNELSGQGQTGGPCVNAEKILPPASKVGRDSMFVDPKAPRKVAADYFTHPLRLASVYHHFVEDGKKEISTYHREAANPDFIFYTIEKKKILDKVTQVYEVPELRLLRRLSLPDRETLENTLGPWPNPYVPSDHIPLVADFVLTKSQKKRK